MAPKKKRNEMKHSNIICLRLSDIELELVNHAASQAKLSRSDYLRNLILDHKMAIHYEVVIDSQTIKMLLAEYGKIGSNLNQIAKYFNTGGAYSKSITNEIQQCLYDLYRLKKELLKMIGDYLIFQHDESTGKMILDEFNRPLRRDEFYMDGLNCDPDTFDVECYECNEHFKKNRSRSEIKSHHYIISFDPDDKSGCGLTGEKAQALRCISFLLYNHCSNVHIAHASTRYKLCFGVHAKSLQSLQPCALHYTRLLI